MAVQHEQPLMTARARGRSTSTPAMARHRQVIANAAIVFGRALADVDPDRLAALRAHAAQRERPPSPAAIRGAVERSLLDAIRAGVDRGEPVAVWLYVNKAVRDSLNDPRCPSRTGRLPDDQPVQDPARGCTAAGRPGARGSAARRCPGRRLRPRCRAGAPAPDR